MEEEVLEIEELEALRLSDMMEIEQDKAAEAMDVSRGTYQRIVNSARKKLAKALVEGKSIRIHGGNYQVADRCCVRSECGKKSCGRWENGRGCCKISKVNGYIDAGEEG